MAGSSGDLRMQFQFIISGEVGFVNNGQEVYLQGKSIYLYKVLGRHTELNFKFFRVGG